jgi:hypothetical protein
MLDSRNRTLAEVTKADDFIVSDNLISLFLAQLFLRTRTWPASSPTILSSEGSEIYLKPITNYIRPGTPVTFHTVIESARRQGQIPIGYRIAAQSGDAGAAYGIVVNPKKSASITFAPEDRLVVLSED